jgi:hypothetical protein
MYLKVTSFISKNNTEILRHCDRKDLSSMFERPWFKRVWVVQELGLSRGAILYYGKSPFTRDELDSFLAYLYTRGRENIRRHHLDL